MDPKSAWDGSWDGLAILPRHREWKRAGVSEGQRPGELAQPLNLILVYSSPLSWVVSSPNPSTCSFLFIKMEIVRTFSWVLWESSKDMYIKRSAQGCHLVITATVTFTSLVHLRALLVCVALFIPPNSSRREIRLNSYIWKPRHREAEYHLCCPR